MPYYTAIIQAKGYSCSVEFLDAQTAMLELEHAAQEARLQWARGFTAGSPIAGYKCHVRTVAADQPRRPSPQMQQEADDLREWLR